MKNMIKQMRWIALLLFFPTALFAWQWNDLWQTADQQGMKLLQAGKAQQAAQVFKNKDWKSTALYRAGDYAQAYSRFSRKNNSDSQYNAGNAAAHLGRYQEAIAAYDKAIALNPKNTDAITNREIIKKLMEKKSKQNKACNSKKPATASNDQQKKPEDQSSNGKSSAQQKQAQNNSSKKENDEKQSAQNQSQKDGNNDTNNQQQANHEPNSKDNNSQSTPQNKTLGPKDQKAQAYGKGNEQEEDKKQMLRRVADDPGGLLRQKFLRDYFRRHSNASDEGEN